MKYFLSISVHVAANGFQVSLEEMKEGMGKFARENNLVHYVGGAAASPPSLGAVGGRVGKAKQRRGHVETQEVEELYSFLVSHHTSQVGIPKIPKFIKGQGGGGFWVVSHPLLRGGTKL